MFKYSKVLFLAVLVFFSIFIVAPSVAADVCGDGKCGTAENSCTCAMDCSSCEGLVPGKTCFKYACSVTNQCAETVIYNCIGNFICETNEDYGNAPSDCDPTEMTIEVLKPEAGNTFLRGDSVLIKTKVTSHGRTGAGSDLNIYGFYGFTTLLNDGKHDDELLSDMFFGNSFLVSSEDLEGINLIKVKGKFKTAFQDVNIPYEVKPILESPLKVSTEIILGGILDIEGQIQRHGVPLGSLDTNIEIYSGETLLHSESQTTSETGNLKVQYHSSLIEPAGNWTVKVKGKDELNNYIEFSQDVTVLAPGTKAFLEISILSKIEPDYKRLGFLDLIVSLKDSKGTAVEGADVSVVMPEGEEVEFVETNSGQYSLSFSLPKSIPLDEQTLLIKATKNNEGIVYEGTSELKIVITSSDISVDLLSPSRKSFSLGEQMLLKVALSYSDGSSADNADVKVLIAGKVIELNQAEPGIYQTEIVLANDFQGLQEIELQSIDAFGNEGYFTTKVEISGESIFYLIQNNLLTIIVLLVVVVVGVFFLTSNARKMLNTSQLQAKKAETLELISLIQDKYFNKGHITKEEYKKALDEYESTLKDVDEKLSKLTKEKKQ